ncbi:MAG: type I DNA topoisomerase [Candidatus Poribacteria bacterium]|nr:type I DNA topoisomerase [Candidatus Poribacteria bacterium]
MPKSLVVVESPAKAKTIEKILGKDYIVDSSVGHIRDLPKKELGVDVENNFKPKYVLIRGKGPVVKAIQEKAKKVDCIYLAADPDREGEAICWHLATELKKTKKPIYRIVYNEVTQTAILEAIQNPGTIDQSLVDAQQARRVLDRLVGYQISPILWRSVKPGLSAGRVQSVAVRLICEREAEIEAFKPEEYWTLTATLTPTPKEHLFPAKLHKIGTKKGEINNYGFRIDEARANELAADAKEQTYIVEKVQKRERRQKTAAPFITSTLQQEAARKLRFTAKRTMMVAQKLYEGLDIGKEGLVGLITYMRTDSTRIAQDAIDEVRKYIDTTYGAEYLPTRAVSHPSKGGAQDAHEAIRPTLPLRTPESLKSYLNKEQYRLYELIWKRFIASQMNPAIFDATTIDIKAGRYIFRATGSVIKFDGFRRVYMEGQDDVTTNENNTDEGNTTLPNVKEGETLDLRKLDPKQHYTQPPPRYNEATLVKALEAKEIGRPSTYATILSTIQDRGYVTMEQRRLLPTDVGKLVNELLIHGFPNIVDVEFTKEMEQKLDTIAEGEVDWVDTLGEFYPSFQEALEEAPDKMYEARKAMETDSGEQCDKCGGNMIVKWGRYGRFLGCSNYPECENIKALNGDDTAAAEPEETDTLCEKCGEPMVIKQSRAGARFLACSGYPKCKNAKPVPMGVDCPESDCDGYLGERRSKRGKVFYGCSNYPTCGFASWDKPIAEPCPQCDATYLVEKVQKTGETLHACASKDCNYTNTPE